MQQVVEFLFLLVGACFVGFVIVCLWAMGVWVVRVVRGDR